MSDALVLEMARALLIVAVETKHYRLVQEWDEEGAWYRMSRKDGAPVAIDEALYRLDEALVLLLDAEADAQVQEVTGAEVGEQQPNPGEALW